MRALLWSSYGLLLAGGCAYYAMSALERAFERVTVPQMLYLTYLLALTTFSGMALRSPVLTFLFGFVPALAFLLFTMYDEPEDWRRLRDSTDARLTAIDRALDADPADILALEARADLYTDVGEVDLALDSYHRLISLYQSPARAGLGRLLTAALGKKERLERAGASCAPDPRVPELLRACPACGAVVLRASYACRCGRELNGSPWEWRALVANRALERWGLRATTMLALAFLPYLYWCGSVAYGVLLAAWALGLATSRGAGAAVGVSRADDRAALAAQAGLLAALLAGFALRPGTTRAVPRPVPRAVGPESAASRAARMPGMTLRQFEEDARALSARADALGGGAAEDASGVAARATARLSSSDPGDRLEAAQTLCDIRYAARAEAAIPALQGLLSDSDAGVRDAAELALARVRYCASSALCRSKWAKP